MAANERSANSRAFVVSMATVVKMSDEILGRVGIHVDDLNYLRLLNPEVADVCNELHSESKEFGNQLGSFRNTTESLIQTLEELAGLVESEKLRAMASRTALKAADKQKMADAQQMQIIIRERQVELDRLRAELAAALQIEQEQREYLQQITNN